MKTSIKQLKFNATRPVEPRTKMPGTRESWILVPQARLH